VAEALLAQMAYLKEKGKLVSLDKEISTSSVNHSHTLAYLNEKIRELEF
jgi:hypothetical protein